MGQTREPWLTKLLLLVAYSQDQKSQSMNMWQRNCPVCKKPLEKKHPAETVPCSCGKYVWKG
jgi:hypothetical protein